MVFKWGRNSLEDEARSGRPASAATPETIDAVRTLIEVNRRITYDELEAVWALVPHSYKKLSTKNSVYANSYADGTRSKAVAAFEEAARALLNERYSASHDDWFIRMQSGSRQRASTSRNSDRFLTPMITHSLVG